jgi:hypothetical protein
LYLFHFLRSFLPLRNPIGFGVSDFVELALALLLAGLLFGWGYFGGWLRKLAEHERWCLLLIGLLPVVLRLILLPRCPVPIPAGADDFGYVLLADTLRHFRLANPPHPLSQFFEAVFILQRPAYSSIYPLAQGIVLAFGRILFGNFWAGALISSGVLCAACYWMLRGWVSAGWALLGGFLAVMTFGPLCQWTNSYWGGDVSAIAGCLVFGALPRLKGPQQGRRRRGSAVVLGIGLALQLLSRPFEFLILLAAVLMYLIWTREWRLARGQIAIVAACIIGALILSGAQNRAVTGSLTTLPYSISRYQYGVPTTFTFQPNPVPHRALTAEQRLDYQAQAVAHDTAAGPFQRFAYRVRYYRFFLFAPLYLAVLAFLISATTRIEWWIISTVLLFAVATDFYPYFYPHYVAAEAPLFVLIAVRGLERINRWKPEIGRLIVLFCGAQFVFWYGLHLIAGQNLWGAFHYEPQDFINYGDSESRIAIQDTLARQPGQQLVFVRYGPRHEFHEWVHNDADIDAARIVWARDLGEEDDKLRAYFPNRSVWLLEPDAKPPRLTPYPVSARSETAK